MCRVAVLLNLLLSVILFAGPLRVPSRLFTWRKEDPRRRDFSLGLHAEISVRVVVVCYTAVFSVVTQCDTKNGCVAD